MLLSATFIKAMKNGQTIFFSENSSKKAKWQSCTRWRLYCIFERSSLSLFYFLSLCLEDLVLQKLYVKV